MKYDLHNNVLQVLANQPKTIATNTTTAGIVIDTLGFNSIEFMAFVGARTDGTYTLTLSESDVSGSGYTTVDASDILGDLSAISLNVANENARFGYIGSKQYLRCDVVSTGTSSGATVGVVAMLSNAIEAPTAASV